MNLNEIEARKKIILRTLDEIEADIPILSRRVAEAKKDIVFVTDEETARAFDENHDLEEGLSCVRIF